VSNTSISLIIPNWNGLRHLQTCLDAVLRQTYPQYEIVLVDNGSSDGSCEFVAENYPQVRLLRSEKNLGFAGGTNLGIRSTESDYVATLNNDTEAEPTWLEELVTAIESEPRVGMAASKMLFYDRRQMINSAGIAVDRVGMAWLYTGGPCWTKSACSTKTTPAIWRTLTWPGAAGPLAGAAYTCPQPACTTCMPDPAWKGRR